MIGIVAVLLTGCGPKPPVPNYRSGLLGLGTAFSAKEVCSCVFVAGLPEDHCAEWTRVQPDLARFVVDHEAKEVSSRALGLARTVARYEGPGVGCVIATQ